MATLWEMTVFSLSSNSWKTLGLRILLGTAYRLLARVDFSIL